MKQWFKKYWNRLRFSERDADLLMRGQCITIARAIAPEARNIGDFLRGTQQIYDWMNGGRPPPEDLPK